MPVGVLDVDTVSLPEQTFDRTMKTFSHAALLVFALIVFAYPTSAQDGPGDARLFDEFGALSGCDGSARLANYYVELSRDPNNLGYVIGYGPEGEGSGTGKFVLQATKHYLVEVRGLEADRLRYIYGGRAEDPRRIYSKLYVVPHGAHPPNAKRHTTPLPVINGKYEDYDYGYEGLADGTGPPDYGNLSIAVLADAMKRQPDSVAYFVAYSYADSTPGAWRRIARREADDLAARDLPPDRIKIIYAGVRPSTEDESRVAYIELWLLPKDASAPAKSAEPEGSPREAVMIGSHYQLELADPASERSTLRSFADFLLEDPRMNACLILHPGLGGDDPAAVIADDRKVDLSALVQRWKSELRTKHGIAENRITVMIAPSEFSGGSIDVWVLPADAALPDPFAEEPAVEDTEPAKSEDR